MFGRLNDRLDISSLQGRCTQRPWRLLFFRVNAGLSLRGRPRLDAICCDIH